MHRSLGIGCRRAFPVDGSPLVWASILNDAPLPQKSASTAHTRSGSHSRTPPLLLFKAPSSRTRPQRGPGCTRLLEGVEARFGAEASNSSPHGTPSTQGHRSGLFIWFLRWRQFPCTAILARRPPSHLTNLGPTHWSDSLARGENAFFTALTTSEATVVRLTTEQLQIALTEDPSISTVLTALAIRSPDAPTHAREDTWKTQCLPKPRTSKKKS